jgi:ssDNA-binding replication factor A large subunit
MKISELTAGMKNVNLGHVKVVSIGPVREFEKFGKKGRVATAVIEDGSGKIDCSLWNEQLDSVKEGSEISIIDGYVSEFRGRLQVSSGRTGRMEVH